MKCSTLAKFRECLGNIIIAKNAITWESIDFCSTQKGSWNLHCGGDLPSVSTSNLCPIFITTCGIFAGVYQIFRGRVSSQSLDLECNSRSKIQYFHFALSIDGQIQFGVHYPFGPVYANICHRFHGSRAEGFCYLRNAGSSFFRNFCGI